MDVTQADLDQMLNGFDSKVETLRRILTEEVKKIEARMEEVDQQIATLVVGFGEQVVMIEGLISQVLHASEEERTRFQENIARARVEMLKIMQEGARGAMAKRNKGPAAPVADVDEPNAPMRAEE